MIALKKRSLLLIGLGFLCSLSMFLLQASRSNAFEIDGSRPHFQTKKQSAPSVKKQRKKYKRKLLKKKRVKRKIAARPKPKVKRRIKRKVMRKVRRKVRRKYRKKRRKQKKSKMSRMTNHDAESKRKHRVITAKTFEYPDLMTDAASKGETLFKTHCVGCHGENALGSESGPPLLHDYYRPGHHADLAIYAAPLYGVEAHHWKFGNMPKIEAVTKKDVHNLIIFIRTMQRANGIY